MSSLVHHLARRSAAVFRSTATRTTITTATSTRFFSTSRCSSSLPPSSSSASSFPSFCSPPLSSPFTTSSILSSPSPTTVVPPSSPCPPSSVGSVCSSDPDSYFGTNVFCRRTMRTYLSPADYDRYISSVRESRSIDFSTANAVAAALLRWALERGATHYTHWFQPITGTVAEKHDTFVDTLRDGETPLVRFTGKQLIMGEPDGSSFPSGGLRATHIARGYTAWDPASPPFLVSHTNGSTLYIPSCFFSWSNSHSLDEKIPLLRSELALQRETLRLFKILGGDYAQEHTHVHMDAGLEQEFFLIAREYYLRRPDLMTTGRTVLGAAPPKGQELEDQYFGPISTKVLDCIHDFEIQCWKLGIPLQTRHREVAPGQYEVAPKFAPANVGTDRNLLMMELLKKTARKHGLAALLHEKPFKGVNGSGKHNNWSLGSNSCPSLLNPGEQPDQNLTFMLFLAATIRAIDLHSDLMRVAITGVGNDHRLGANEAPPAIVSCYLGDDIERAVDRFIANDPTNHTFNTQINLGIHGLPDLHRVPTDRNRTSTFAFTGNKFEFRAVGSSHNPSRSNQVLNTIVADSIRYIANELEKLKKEGVETKKALKKVTQETLKKHKRVVFNGNGYSEEWAKEAARRGLPNLKSTPAALDQYYTDKNVKLFETMSVLSAAELQARSHILFEEYVKKLLIEAKVLIQLVQTSIVPVGLKYQGEIGQAIRASKENLPGAQVNSQLELLKQVGGLVDGLLKEIEELKSKLHDVHEQSSMSKSAHFAETNVIPLMLTIREKADRLEQLVPAKDWPLPTYHEMLFHQD